VQIALALLLIGLLVTFHELGHYLAGRFTGVYIHEFAVGFGPTIVSRETDETRYSLRLIPVGGFCRFAGEDADKTEDDQHIPKHRLLSSQSPGKRALIMVSGSLANILVAALAFCIVFAFVGVNRANTTILETIPGYPAANVGLLPGDKILQIDETKTESWEQLVTSIQDKAGVPISIVYEREGQVSTVTVTPIEVNGVGMLGIRPTTERAREGVIKGFYNGVKETVLVSFLWIQGILGMILGKVAPEIAGPVGITQILGEAAGIGLGELMYLAGALSANLALMNLLPIPALDGSRLMFLAIEAVRGRPIDPEKESMVHFMGFLLLMTLFAVVTYQDILRLIRG
jgi:regulator of sigma E protease